LKKILILLVILTTFGFSVTAGGHKESGKEKKATDTESASDDSSKEVASPEGIEEEKVSIDKTLATVNFFKFEGVTERQFNEKKSILEQQMKKTFTAKQDKELLDAMIDEILIAQAAERDGFIVRDSQVLQAIRQNLITSVQGNPQLAQKFQKANEEEIKKIVTEQLKISWDIYVSIARNQIIQQQYILEKKKTNFQSIEKVNEEEILAFFNTNEMSFNNPEYVRFSQIFFNTRKMTDEEKMKVKVKADKANRRLRSKESTFEKLVRELSEDAASQSKNGDVGFIPKNDINSKRVLGETFFNEIFSMKEGASSGVLVSDIGFHIIKITEKIDAKFLKLKDTINPVEKTTIREYIRFQLSSMKQQKAFQAAAVELLAEIKQEAEINYISDKF